jgi:hypothetical protein
MANKFYGISSFFIRDDHQLALVKLSDSEIAGFVRLRERLADLQKDHPRVLELVVDHAPVFWLPWDEELVERASEEISGDEWDARVRARPEDYEEPETSYVHVTAQGLHFSCVTETDDGHTATITWETLEQ